MGVSGFIYALTLNIFIPLISLILAAHGMEDHVILAKISKYLLLIWEFATILIMMLHHSLFKNQVLKMLCFSF